MSKPPVFHDRRPSEPPRSGWYIDAKTAGILVFVVFVVAWIFGTLFLPGCASSPPPCVPTHSTAIVAECRAAYVRAGCDDDPDAKCPELVKACDARVDALSDQEICTP